MQQHKQLFRHRPQEGQIGDCWRTAIACLLDRHPVDVPHFVEHCWDDAARGRANANAWLASQGLTTVEVPYQCDLAQLLDLQHAVNPGVYYLLAGNSATGVGHSVIACDDRIVWDPSVDDVGITGPMSVGYYWVSWLVPLTMVRQ